MRAAVGFVIALSAGLQVAAVATAVAQSPVPLQRSMDLYAPLQAKVAEQAAAQPQQAQTMPATTAAAAPAPTAASVNRDRFGTVVRGTTCAEHWANCAYDPTRPRR